MYFFRCIEKYEPTPKTMATPTYLIEQQYALYPVRPSFTLVTQYEVESPETRFERRVFQRFHEAKKHLYHEEYGLALDAFQELRQLILRTVNPQLPPRPRPGRAVSPGLLANAEILTPLLERAAEMVRVTPPVEVDLPDSIFNDAVTLPAEITQKINEVQLAGDLRITSHQAPIDDLLGRAEIAVADAKYAGAIDLYRKAIELVPRQDRTLNASLHHDLGILQEKTGDLDGAVESIQQGAKLFQTAKNFSGQAYATRTLGYLQRRQGQEEEAKQTLSVADRIVRKNNLHVIKVSGRKQLAVNDRLGFNSLIANPVINHKIIANPGLDIRPNQPVILSRAAANVPAFQANDTTPTLITQAYLKSADRETQKTVFLASQENALPLVIDGNGRQNIADFMESRVASTDIAVVAGYLANPIQMVAYLPHLYFYVLPVAIGDCYRGLGRFLRAEEHYLSTLPYPYLNRKTEVIHLWIRLAEVALERGDRAYRAARDRVDNFGNARQFYERFLGLDGTVPNNSPLYNDPKFSGIRQRVTDFLQPHIGDLTAAFGSQNRTENPEILSLVLEAKNKLVQIDAGLNFFGFARNYIPPFTFEHLQNTARYFAQQASQIESKYIQFKSTAENEELRYDQMDQQVELARQTVILEERSVQEAEEGVDVAQATRDYAATRRQNAQEARDNFNDARWELLELEEAIAWSSASAVDRDDQVKLTWNGHYYNSSDKRRNVVLKELTYQKTRINQDLQAANLQNAVEDAQAYENMANEQIDQAVARLNVARQRREIAELQQRQAEENREFLELKEFGASQWYRMAKLVKRLTRKYLDQAIEIAMLAQRAYRAETERNIRPIRYDYLTGRPGGLLGADQLLQDIDYFSFDLVTNVTTRKAPVKRTFSLGDHFPLAFDELIRTGTCRFHTRLRDFDRQHPGLYGCKIKNIELLVVGITRATSIAGSLRNLGASRFRRPDGSAVARLYPADVMPLSQYDFRNDALAFRFDPKDLKLFENHGVATHWELQLPRDANDFDLREILDIQLVVYYNGFHSPTLEQNIRAALPAGGSGTAALGLRLLYPDERFYLRNRGQAVLDIGAGNFPSNFENLVLTQTRLRLSGEASFVNDLTLRIASASRDTEITVTTDANGEVPAGTFAAWAGAALFDTWTVTVTPEDNPGKVVDGELPLSDLDDLFFFLGYDFTYRT